MLNSSRYPPSHQVSSTAVSSVLNTMSRSHHIVCCWRQRWLHYWLNGWLLTTLLTTLLTVLLTTLLTTLLTALLISLLTALLTERLTVDYTVDCSVDYTIDYTIDCTVDYRLHCWLNGWWLNCCQVALHIPGAYNLSMHLPVVVGTVPYRRLPFPVTPATRCAAGPLLPVIPPPYREHCTPPPPLEGKRCFKAKMSLWCSVMVIHCSLVTAFNSTLQPSYSIQ